jgi:hypothetical protein
MPDDTAAADRVAAWLAAVQERWGAAEGMTWHDYPTALEHLGQALRSLADVPRLLAAVEAALAKHKPTPSVRLVPCEAHKRWRGSLVGAPDIGQEFETENLRVRRACPACQVFDEPYCGTCVGGEGRWQDWPCAEYRAITTELLRGTDG